MEGDEEEEGHGLDRRVVVNISRLVESSATPPSSISHTSPYLLSGQKIIPHCANSGLQRIPLKDIKATVLNSLVLNHHQKRKKEVMASVNERLASLRSLESPPT